MAARMTEPAVGASTCASCSQVCTGHIGNLTANEAKKASQRVGLFKPAFYLLKSVLPAGAFEHRPHRLRRIGVIPAIELVKTRQLVLFRRRIDRESTRL